MTLHRAYPLLFVGGWVLFAVFIVTPSFGASDPYAAKIEKAKRAGVSLDAYARRHRVKPVHQVAPAPAQVEKQDVAPVPIKTVLVRGSPLALPRWAPLVTVVGWEELNPLDEAADAVILADADDVNFLDDLAEPLPAPADAPLVSVVALAWGTPAPSAWAYYSPAGVWVGLVILTGWYLYQGRRRNAAIGFGLRSRVAAIRVGLWLRRWFDRGADLLWNRFFLPRAPVAVGRVTVPPAWLNRREPRLEAGDACPGYGPAYGQGRQRSRQRLGSESSAPWARHRSLTGSRA